MLELYRNILLIITVTRLFFYLLFCSVEILLYSKLKYHISSSIDNTYHITDDPVVTLNVGKNSFQNVITFFNSLSLNMKDVDPIDFNEKFHSFIHSTFLNYYGDALFSLFIESYHIFFRGPLGILFCHIATLIK